MATSRYLPSIHLQSYMRERFGFKEGLCPVSEEMSSRTLALPFHTALSADDQAYVADAVRAFSRAAWHAIGCRDVARVDFMLDARGPWFLEINTMPGFTDHSLVPKAARHAGIAMEELVSRLVRSAIGRRGRPRAAA